MRGLCHFGVHSSRMMQRAQAPWTWRVSVFNCGACKEATIAVIKVCTRLISCGFALGLVLSASASDAADMTARQVTKLLFATAANSPPDLSNKDLSGLDLSGLDFKKARLDGVNFYSADLSGANLSGASLKSARLDRATLIGANFSSADLSGASLLWPNVFADMAAPERRSGLTFAGARLVGANFNGRFDGVDFERADLTDAFFGPRDPREEVLITPMMSFGGRGFYRRDSRGRRFQWRYSRKCEVRRRRSHGCKSTGCTSRRSRLLKCQPRRRRSDRCRHARRLPERRTRRQHSDRPRRRSLRT